MSGPVSLTDETITVAINYRGGLTQSQTSIGTPPVDTDSNDVRLMIQLSEYVVAKSGVPKRPVTMDFPPWLHTDASLGDALYKKPQMQHEDRGFFALHIPWSSEWKPIYRFAYILHEGLIAPWVDEQAHMAADGERLIIIVGLNNPCHLYQLISPRNGRMQVHFHYPTYLAALHEVQTH